MDGEPKPAAPGDARNHPVVVYKVVRREDRRLISAILPMHLSQVYREASGRIVTVLTALAFDSLDGAVAWRRRCYAPLVRDRLEVWRAEADSVRPPGLTIACMELNPEGTIGTGLVYFRRDSVTREQWTAALRKLATVRDDFGYLEVAGLILKVHPEPQASVECSNLRLVERVGL